MLRLMTVSIFVASLGSAWPASADVPPNCGPNKKAKNALECECVLGASPQVDGSCKFVMPGGGPNSPIVPPGNDPDVPVTPIPPSCGTASCGPSVFYTPENPDGTPRLPGLLDDLTTDDLNILQQKNLINRMQMLQNFSAGDLSLELEAAGPE